MNQFTMKQFVEDIGLHEEVNPLADVPYHTLLNAERNLREMLRFTRMAKVAARMEWDADSIPRR